MNLIKRSQLDELKNHLSKKEISLIAGPRQAGKTTLMLLVKDFLQKQGKKCVFLSLDNEIDRQFFTSQHNLVKKIELEAGKKKAYIFIDEIQRKESAGLFLKGIYDLQLPYKFIVSGSGSLELKEKIRESLTGRKRIFDLNTISFEEFVNFKTGYRYEDKLGDFFSIEKEKTEGLLSEYLNFGGYPRLILEERIEEKRKIIDEIFSSYIEKDISYLLKVEKIDAFRELVKILASQVGQLVNYSELASTVGISLQTIKNYLWYGEKTFIFQRLTPYFTNVRKEITKSPVVYFYDLGLRNYSLGLYGNLVSPNELGLIFENFIFNILKERLRFSGAILHFWRTQDKAEVDFVVNFGREVLPVEVKYKSLNRPEATRSLKSFIQKHQPKKALVINLSLKESATIGKTEVAFLPFWALLDEKAELF